MPFLGLATEAVLREGIGMGMREKRSRERVKRGKGKGKREKVKKGKREREEGKGNRTVGGGREEGLNGTVRLRGTGVGKERPSWGKVRSN